MAQNPYFSKNMTAINDPYYNAAVNRNMQSQFQQRNVFDTTTMMPNTTNRADATFLYPNNYQAQMSRVSDNCSCCPCVQPLQTQVPQIPEGLTYTFNPAAQQYALSGFMQSSPPYTEPNFNQRQQYISQMQNQQSAVNTQNQQLVNIQQPPRGMQFQQQQQPQYPVQQQLTLEQQIALKALEKHGLETLLLQEQLQNNQFQLQFHHDRHTSTNDLLPGPTQTPRSKGHADFNNAAIATEFISCSCIRDQDQKNQYSDVRRLNLTKSRDLHGERKPLVIDESEETNDGMVTDGTTQTPLERVDRKLQTNEDSTKDDSGKGKQKHKKKGRKKHRPCKCKDNGQSSSESGSEDSSSSEEGSEKGEQLQDL